MLRARSVLFGSWEVSVYECGKTHVLPSEWKKNLLPNSCFSSCLKIADTAEIFKWKYMWKSEDWERITDPKLSKEVFHQGQSSLENFAGEFRHFKLKFWQSCLFFMNVLNVFWIKIVVFICTTSLTLTLICSTCSPLPLIHLIGKLLFDFRFKNYFRRKERGGVGSPTNRIRCHFQMVSPNGDWPSIRPLNFPSLLKLSLWTFTCPKTGKDWWFLQIGFEVPGQAKPIIFFILKSFRVAWGGFFSRLGSNLTKFKLKVQT